MVEVYTSEVTIPDLLEAPGYGLLDNITWVPGDSAGHWQGGIQYDVDCPASAPTIMACFPNAPVPVADKEETWEHITRGARAFTAYDRYDCSIPGRGANLDDLNRDGRDKALRALAASAAFTVERVFWSGNVDNSPAMVFPNLVTIGASPIVTGGIVLQPAGQLITGGLDVTEGLGLLEEAIAECYHGKAFIHIPSILSASLAQANLCMERNGKLFTYAGNRVIVGRGYDASIGPNNTVNATGVTQMYATSPVFGIRGTPRAFGTVESMDRNVNTLVSIAEQTHLLGWHCCLFGVTVTTGGAEAGEVTGPAAAA